MKRYIQNSADSFWDLDDFMPPRKRRESTPPPTSIHMAEVVSSSEHKTSEGTSESHFSIIPPKQDSVKEDIREYKRPDNRFIASVRVRHRASSYRFYGQFCRDATKYLHAEGKECPFTPYFSYIPQYAQLTREQLDYYLFFRSSIRRGEYPKAQESYFYLFVYEIINLPNLITPKEGLALLCNAWAAYRKQLPRIDKYMTEWVMDYCLIHNLPCPHDFLRPFLAAILPLASLKEFYLGGMGDYSEEGSSIALAFLSTYRFRESRYATGEHQRMFEEHILGAMARVLSHLFEAKRDFVHEAARTICTHEAFCGALCAQDVRCQLEIAYYAIQDVSYLRASVTAAVKYAENKLRAALSIKSRLAVPALPQALRELIDAYFEEVRGALCPPKVMDIPAYERLYDAPAGSADLSLSEQIERESWSTTRILVPEEDLQSYEEKKAYSSADVNFGSEQFELTVREKTYLTLLLNQDRGGVHALLVREGILEDELASLLNDKSMDRLGDVVLEACPDGYRLISDYIKEVLEWIQ